MSSDFIVQVGHHQLQLLKGDITAIAVDAIVNAANSQLAGGGGVDGAIHRTGGPEIMAELHVVRSRIGYCETGSAVVTGAGRLPAKYVFHAVGPIYRDGNHGEAATLQSCYTTCLKLAAEHEVKTISFPSISTGVYGYPVEEAAAIAVRVTAEWLREHSGPVRVIKLVQFSDRDHEIYRRFAQKLRDGFATGTHS
ncbi:MAG: O-acetyl-ADP-ribose deacetylase [Acidobacteriaceae bacterium]|nr:O-acetyl-ADP-ribose deacetylase [Acidobacteriaceae bacterium]MBV9033622.1 O-acetyl-ADP-ribose deacetylase [Acidobacteriaceae bacterium]MBV9226028.1 O-acetyl-ADP-ribose deacetylase [Acidobacteriaceae bacterium]MBV9305198.1 O-acetyl-ADP-ribose deacetylase [Acidobacteriaceae bacterium]